MKLDGIIENSMRLVPGAVSDRILTQLPGHELPKDFITLNVAKETADLSSVEAQFRLLSEDHTKVFDLMRNHVEFTHPEYLYRNPHTIQIQDQWGPKPFGDIENSFEVKVINPGRDEAVIVNIGWMIDVDSIKRFYEKFASVGTVYVLQLPWHSEEFFQATPGDRKGLWAINGSASLTLDTFVRASSRIVELVRVVGENHKQFFISGISAGVNLQQHI